MRVIGLELRNLDAGGRPWKLPAGIWVRGAGHHIELRDNAVHDIKNSCRRCGAHGIAVYGRSAAESIHDLLIDGNEVYGCKLGWSESVVLNGNVEQFVVSNNTIHDNDNIGIDLIGFEGECPDPALDRARDGTVTGNLVYNIDSLGNPAYGTERSAGGIYVDGGTRVWIDRNVVHHANIGIELASEHAGKDTSYIRVTNNLVYHSHVAGLAMGGYDRRRGYTAACTIANNSLYHNDTDQTGSGELLIQYDTRNNVVKNNLFQANSQNLFVSNPYARSVGNVVDYNLYFSPGGANGSTWTWKRIPYSSFAAWQNATGNDADGLFADPLLADPADGDLHLQAGSPAIDAGEDLGSGVFGLYDIDGEARVQGAGVEIGADERE